MGAFLAPDTPLERLGGPAVAAGRVAPKTWQEPREGTLNTRKSLAAITVFGLILTGCESTTDLTDGTVCTLIAVSSLNVTVRDSGTGQRICDATVVAVQDGTTYELRRSGTPDACTYAGPEERSGTFEVRVSKTGYRPGTATAQVGRDECHVIPVQVTVDVQPS
jgi:hypothetical protein